VEKATYFFFFIALFSFPLQLGKHFWPSFSFVLGLRIDYLSPTIYLSDIFIVLFIIFSLFSYFFPREKIQVKKTIFFFLFSFFLSLILSLLVNGPKPLFFLKTAKILEFLLFSFFVSFLDFKKIFYPAILLLSLGIIWTSFIAIFQFGQQQSLGLWLLGERKFNVSTPGISQVIYDNQLILRPYSTFAHPNLFGAYLALFLPWILFFLFRTKKIFTFFFFLLSFLCGVIALFLTFSRTAWLVGFGSTFFILAFFLWQKRKKFPLHFPLQIIFTGAIFFTIICLFLFVGPFVLDRFLTIGTSDSHSLVLRAKFAKAAVSMFLSSPIFGLGPGNFIPKLPYFWQLQETIRVLQPAHNLILLVLAELGIFGATTFILLFARTFIWLLTPSSRQKEMILLFTLSLSSIFFLSLFDHYFWTLQQGLFAFWLILGLAWSFCSKQAFELVDKKERNPKV
jgi:O-antigen ligase